MAGARGLVSHVRAWARPSVAEALCVPSALDRWWAVPGGREWLQRLPEIVRACADTWDLRLGEAYNGGKVGLALRVERSDGSPAVLKVNFPDHESEHEAIALGLWRGNGAVRLLELDDELYALLVERCDPGSQLSDVADEDEANTAAARVLASIWRPPPRHHPFGRLDDVAAHRAKVLPTRWRALGRPFERPLLDAAVAAYRELGPAQEEAVVCHQDFHGGNILRATREPWLAIDPKPSSASGRSTPHGCCATGARRSSRTRTRTAGCAAGSTCSRANSGSTASAYAAGESRAHWRGESTPAGSTALTSTVRGCC